MRRFGVCILHPFDPRGNKVGGIETHVRMMLQHAPPNCRVLLVGVDGRGDCDVGKVHELSANGRAYEFMPIMRFPEEKAHVAARALTQSLTLRFAAALVLNLFRIRRAIRAMRASVELERPEFALVPFLLGAPTVQILHGVSSKDDTMDSLIKKHWFIHRASQAAALRCADVIVCVNPDVESQVRQTRGGRNKKVLFMPVPVDARRFHAAEFDVGDEIFRIVFAGRLDSFKDPPMMFKTIRQIVDRLNGRCEFHYIGGSDPHRYPEFKDIDEFTVRHGLRSSEEVAEIMRRCHAGILTSFFEGMPCYLLEVLSSGRPVVAIRLPQYGLVIEDGVSGAMVDRATDEASTIQQLTDRLLSAWAAIRESRLSPWEIHRKAQPFSVDALLGGHFAVHEKLSRER